MNFFAMNSIVMNSLLSDSDLAHMETNIQIRRGQPDDADLILEMHRRLSDDSLYKRYHAPRQPTGAEIAQMCQQNGENGRLLVAAVPGMIVGMAYYILSDSATADTAFLVEDRFQGQGIGKRLVQALTQQALAQGIRFFDAYVLPSNRPMIRLLHKTGQLVYNKLDYGTCEMRVQLPMINSQLTTRHRQNKSLKIDD